MMDVTQELEMAKPQATSTKSGDGRSSGTADTPRQHAIERIRDLMAKHDLTLGDIRPPLHRTKHLRLHVDEDAKIKARAVYRDPATGKVWDGRGAVPQWLKDYEAAEQPRDKFRIKTGWGRLAGQGAKKAPVKKTTAQKKPAVKKAARKK